MILNGCSMIYSTSVVFSEYWELIGASHIYLYVFGPELTIDNLYSLVKTKSTVTIINWTVIQHPLRTSTAHLAARNHCLYHRINNFRFVTFTQYNDVIILPSDVLNLQNLMEQESALTLLRQHGGFHIQPVSGVRSTMFVVHTRSILTIMADSFISLYSVLTSGMIFHPHLRFNSLTAVLEGDTYEEF